MRNDDTRRVRRLKRPQPIEVQADSDDLPLRLRLQGIWQEVWPTRRPWRIDQHWWRADAVRRVYYRLEIRNGPPITVYYDEVAQAWFRQEY